MDVGLDQVEDVSGLVDSNKLEGVPDVVSQDLKETKSSDLPIDLPSEILDLVIPPPDLSDETSEPVDVAGETSAPDVVDLVADLPPDEICEPSCDGLECGDDGCGGSCGECSADDPCSSLCDLGICVPDNPTEEVCGNGVDDDCDGEDSFCVPPPAMAHEDGYFVDLFEASNCAGTACSIAGVLPWTGLSFEEAEQACNAAGKRLCTLPEWSLTCATVEGLPFPYGDVYFDENCNTEGTSVGSCGSWPDCDTESGVFDLVGNAPEWVAGDDDELMIAGGSFADGAAAKCQLADAIGEGTEAGFRCCLRWDDDIDGDGHVSSADCNDGDLDINPNAIEECDGIDNNCSGEIDEGDDVDGDGFMECFDCNDLFKSINPDATEKCDAIDNNCDGQIDEGDEICDDGNYCTIDVCNGFGECEYSPKKDTIPCSAKPQDECWEGECICVGDCSVSECGSDGCDGSCGNCPGPQDACFGGVCSCQPLCPENSCDDGCGGNCGGCEAPLVCMQGFCVGQCDDGNDTDWDGCTNLELSEFLVNSYTTNKQSEARVATWADGRFVVVWTSVGQDGSGDGVYAQMFDSMGSPEGEEIEVPTLVEGAQKSPMVTTLANQQFAVVWTDYGSDGSGDVVVQIFNHLGMPQQDQALAVNVVSQGQHYTADAGITTMNNGTAWVATWTSNEGGNLGVYCQAYKSSFLKDGGEVQANKNYSDSRTSPRVVPLAGTSFVVTWENWNSDTMGIDVWGQRFSSPGNYAGSAFKVNKNSQGKQRSIAMAHYSTNDFIVVWQSDNVDSDKTAIAGQRFTSGANKSGDEFTINTYTTGDQTRPSVAALSNNATVVAWHSSHPDMQGTRSVYRLLEPNSSQGPLEEHTLHKYETGTQMWPRVAGLPNGKFVAVWVSNGQDGDKDGIYARCFKGSLPLYRCTNCGDGVCSDGSEDCDICPIDCGPCN